MIRVSEKVSSSEGAQGGHGDQVVVVRWPVVALIVVSHEVNNQVITEEDGSSKESVPWDYMFEQPKVTSRPVSSSGRSHEFAELEDT